MFVICSPCEKWQYLQLHLPHEQLHSHVTQPENRLLWCIIIITIIRIIIIIAGLQHNSQCVTHHRNGEADIPCYPETLTKEAGDCVCTIT